MGTGGSGTVGAGGAPGTGGKIGTSGTPGTGGKIGTGGAPGTGGASDSGGTSGTGGMSGRDAGRDLVTSIDGLETDGAPVKKDTAVTGSGGSGGGAGGACGSADLPCCPYTDGRAGGTCDDSSNCTSDPAATKFTCSACGGSGQRCCGSYPNLTCQKGMCNQTPPILCP